MDCREEIRKHRATQIALQKSMAESQTTPSKSVPNHGHSTVPHDQAQFGVHAIRPTMPNYVHQSQANMFNQSAQSLYGLQQPSIGYRPPTVANIMQMPQSMAQTGFNPSFMPGLLPIGFPPPPAPIYGYPVPGQRPSIITTPSSGGFAQGERRTSFDPNWSPSFIT